jgi:hypothetical protein
MKNEPTFKEIASAFVAAGSPGASESQAREAGFLARELPYQYRSEAEALKILIRDDETRKVVDLVCRWSARPELVSIVSQRGTVAA